MLSTLRLFLIDKLLKDKEYESAVTSLSNIIKLPKFPNRLAVRCRAQLGCCYYAMKKIRPSVRPLIESLVILYLEANDNQEEQLARFHPINWVKASTTHILPYTIHVVLDGISEIYSTLDVEKHRIVFKILLIKGRVFGPKYLWNHKILQNILNV